MRQPRLKATNPGCLNNVTLHTSLLILPDFLFLFRHVLPRFPSLFAFISDTDDTALFFFFFKFILRWQSDSLFGLDYVLKSTLVTCVFGPPDEKSKLQKKKCQAAILEPLPYFPF